MARVAERHFGDTLMLWHLSWSESDRIAWEIVARIRAGSSPIVLVGSGMGDIGRCITGGETMGRAIPKLIGLSSLPGGISQT